MTISEFNVVIINFQLSSEPSIRPTLATYDSVARLTAFFPEGFKDATFE
jgi:hypothetical protein